MGINTSVNKTSIGTGLYNPSFAAIPAPQFTVTVANATGSSMCLYYKQEKMNTGNLIQGTSLVSNEGLGSIVVEPGKHIKCPVYHKLYVTGFLVEACQPFCCPSGKPLFENVCVEKPAGETKSVIVTASEVKCAKSGELWVDDSGVNHKPKA